MEVHLKIRSRTTVYSSNLTLGPIPGEKHGLKENMNPNVHCSALYNNQGWKQPRYPFTEEWIKMMWYVYIY